MVPRGLKYDADISIYLSLSLYIYIYIYTCRYIHIYACIMYYISSFLFSTILIKVLVVVRFVIETLEAWRTVVWLYGILLSLFWTTRHIIVFMVRFLS